MRYWPLRWTVACSSLARRALPTTIRPRTAPISPASSRPSRRSRPGADDARRRRLETPTYRVHRRASRESRPPIYQSRNQSHVVFDGAGVTSNFRDRPQRAVGHSRQGRGICGCQEDRSGGPAQYAIGAGHVSPDPAGAGCNRPGQERSGAPRRRRVTPLRGQGDHDRGAQGAARQDGRLS